MQGQASLHAKKATFPVSGQSQFTFTFLTTSIQTSLKPAWRVLFGVWHENRLRIVLLCWCSWVTKSAGYRTIHNMLPKYITLHLFNAIEFSNSPTRCDLFSLLHFCRQLYMFRVLTPIIRSSYSCNYSFWLLIHVYRTVGIPTVRYTWISSNSTTRADGSRSG